MSRDSGSRIPDILEKFHAELLADWLSAQKQAVSRTVGSIRDEELRQQSTEFLRLLREATLNGDLNNTTGAEWRPVRDMLAEVSRSRARQGFTPSETALFVFSFKQTLFDYLHRALANEPQELLRDIGRSSSMLDQLGLWTTEVYQRAREELITRQQQELLELSTPVVKLWDGILALPVIGTLDSARTQVVMESLLEMIVNTGCSTAIIDITGVPTVDTLVAQHLLKTVAAARLMGADCIISGIRPQIAQTIVHLGVDLQDVLTKATLADAFLVALQRQGSVIGRRPTPNRAGAPV